MEWEGRDVDMLNEWRGILVLSRRAWVVKKIEFGGGVRQSVLICSAPFDCHTGAVLDVQIKFYRQVNLGVEPSISGVKISQFKAGTRIDT